MMDLGENASIKLWYDFLTRDCGLEIGRDWTWAWRNDCWAVRFTDDKYEALVRLKMRDDS